MLPAGISPSRLGSANSSAVAFLGGQRNQQGLWFDFTLEGGSDEWVTAVAGSVLASGHHPEAVEWCRQAWDAFGIRRIFDGTGGWGFNRCCPEDADSTTWGLRFADRMGLSGASRATLALRALTQYFTPDGGLTTYAHKPEIRAYIGLPDADLSGWTMTHPCNTASAATLPGLNNLLAGFLARRQLPAGNWDAYWVTDTVYPTAYAMEALMMNDPEQYRPAVDRAGHWILKKAGRHPFLPGRFLPCGSPFATAMGLHGLLHTGPAPEFAEKAFDLTRWLLDNQRPDGSWEPSFFLLRIPPDHQGTFREESPDEFPGRWSDRVYPDIRAVLTTSFVLGSLMAVQTHGI